MTAWLPLALAAGAAAAAVSPGGGGSRLAALSLPAAPGRRRGSMGAAALAVAAAVLLLAGPLLVLLVMAALVVRTADHARRERTAQQQERVRALDALSMLGADLRAGRAAADAFDAAAAIACGPSADALSAAASAARLGGDVQIALLSPGSVVAPTLRALAACWQVCSEAGSGLADAVDRLEEGLRAAEAQRLSVAAELAGPRATAQLLAVLPLAGVGLAAALGAHPLDLLLGTPVGLGCLTVGLGLDGLGVVWTRQLTERAAR
ncbi:MAG: tight adherence protein [Actinomycetota bacterium]|nr:tight adherence protein [Actinomycetota bacterium]